MFKILFAFILQTVLVFTPALAQNHDSGTLYRVQSAAYFDCNYPPALAKPKANLSSETFKLQSRFTWYGTTGQTIATEQHAIAAFTQTVNTSALVNTTGQSIWSHGAGAYIGERGLELELWFTQNGQNNAIVWSQDNNRCAQDVMGTLPENTMCLSASPNSTGYITAAPNFTLKRGVNYWVRIEIAPATSGNSVLHADLVEETISGAVVVQSASVGFQNAMIFPSNVDIAATVARTPGSVAEPSITYVVFDYGF